MTTAIEQIIENYPDEVFLKADGFDKAVIGFDQHSMRLIYSVSECVQILVNEGMSVEEAIEHFEYNVSGSYVGEQTPIWCDDTHFK